MIRMANAKFKKLPSLADRWEAFFTHHVKKHANVGDLEDNISLMMEWPQVENVLLQHEETLRQAFLNYCVSPEEMKPGMEAMGEMMNMSEFMSFLTAAGLLDKALTVREARGIFVQVNLDDDLFVQEDSNNSSSELVLDEFIECLVRVAWEKQPLTGMVDDLPGEGDDPDFRQEVADVSSPGAARVCLGCLACPDKIVCDCRSWGSG